MKKFKEFMKKYFNQKVRNIISIFIIIFGLTFMYIYSFKSPTYINKIIATNIYKEPANSAFVDQNFYNCVIDAYNRENNASKGYTDILTDEELKKITKLTCYGEGKSVKEKITNASGLEKLTSLVLLNVSYNQLTILDVSNNTSLEALYVSNNQLTTLDVSNNMHLYHFDVSDNQLTTLDVSNNIYLGDLNVSNNQLTTLGVSNNASLKNLIAYDNQLATLDVSNDINLVALSIFGNQLTTLDVSNNTILEVLAVGNNKLTTLDVSDDINLAVLDVSNNQLTTLDVSNNIALVELHADYNQLTTLDVSNNIDLYYLYVYNNQLTTLDVSNNIYLYDLSVSDNQLTTLDVSNNIYLGDLNVSNNQLTTLDVSNNIDLYYLYVSNNQLTTLDVSNNIDLDDLYVYNNQLTTLDVSNNIYLDDLYVSNNKLTKLDVSNNSKLKLLRATGNLFGLSRKIYLGDVVDVDSSVVKFANSKYTSYKDVISNDNSVIEVIDDNKIVGVSKGTTKVNANVSNSKVNSVVGLNVYNLISVIDMTSDKYLIDGENSYVFTYNDIDSDIIKSNLSVSDSNVSIVIEGNILRLMDDKNIIKEFKIINVASDKYDLTQDVVGVDNTDDIICNNCKANIDDTGLVISDENGNKLYTYKTLNVVSDIYKIIDDKIAVLTDYDDIDKIKNNISVNYGSVNVTSDKKVKIVYNDTVIKKYDLVGIKSNKYNLDGSFIAIFGGNIINNITCYNCDMEIVDNKLLIKYGDSILKEYTLITIDSEYRIIRDTIFVGNDYDDNDLIMSKISVSYGSISISDEKKLVISDGDTVLKEYTLSDSDEYIDIVDYEMDDNELIVSRIDIGTSIDIFNGKIDANIAQGYEIFDKDDNAIGDRVLRTGDKLRVRFSVEPIDYILSVKGDVLGTGNPGVEDGKLIAKHIIDGNVINGGEYLLAADYDGDGNIKMNDVVRMLKERQ